VLTTATGATVVSVAASKVASPESAAVSGAAGSTTSGSSSGGSLVVSGAAGHAIMTGTPWHVVVLAGAVLIFLAGLATRLRGNDWPVMSARYDAPSGGGAGAAGPRGSGQANGRTGARALDSASMWESLNGGQDPTADDPGDDSAAPRGAAPRERKTNA
jgi:Tryptophan-associated transmembrane protein (Trp_oprn_chp)